MSLSLKQDKELTKKDSKSVILLNKYLEQAVSSTQGETKKEASKIVSQMVKTDEFDAVDRADIDQKQAEVKEGLKAFGLKEKASYYMNLNANDDAKDKEATLRFALVSCALATSALISPEVTTGVGLAVAAYSASNIVAKQVGAPKNETDKEKAIQYADLKHAQLALRKLSNHIEKKEHKQMMQEAMAKGLLTPLSGRGGRF